jgi:DNA mismatch repair ATPase MutS
VALVRQTEIAAGRQGKAGLFAREVVGVFTPATVVDDADPAFADMLLSSASTTTTTTTTTGGGGGGGSGGEGEEGEGGVWGRDADTDHYDGNDDGEEDGDSWLAAVVEQPLHGSFPPTPSSTSSSSAAAIGIGATHIAVVAVDVRSHRVRVFSLQCDESSRQELRECLRLLRPLELVVSSDLSQTSWKVTD